MDEKAREHLILRDVSYTFQENRVNALSKLSLEFRRGEVCFLLGENGAGKSTLARLCSGFIRPKGGYLLLGKKPYLPRSPRVAIRKGIALVPQHPDVVGKLRVWENLALAGHVPGVHGPFRLLRPATLINRYENLLKNFGVEIRLEALANTLSAAEIHWLAIAEALVRRPSFIFLDEPTAPYTKEEADRLYQILRQAANLGMGVVIISHRIEEALNHGDRVVVLRQGKLELDCPGKDASLDRLTQAMFSAEPDPGAEARADYLNSPHMKPLMLEPGVEVINCSALEVHNNAGTLLKRITFEVYSGEVVGIHSPQNRSIDMLEDLLASMRRNPRGCLRLMGNPWPQSTVGLRREDVRYIPSRRFRKGIADGLSILDNLVGFRRRTIYHRGIWSGKRFNAFARYLPFLIPRKWGHAIGTLSGGTIQRVILNRELGEPTPRLVLCFEPSWGLDRRLLQQLHHRLRELASRGSAVLYMSSDLEEIRQVAHRTLELKNNYLRSLKP